MLLGMCYHRKHPDRAPKAYAYAAAAKLEDVDFVYFSPSGIDFEAREINGFQYSDARWQPVRTRFPDVVYNSGRIVSLKTRERLERLATFVPVTSYSVGNKWILYDKIRAAGEFDQYLVPTDEVVAADVVFDYVDRYGKAIVKPVFSNQGKGIILVQREAGSGETFLWTEAGATRRIDREGAAKAIEPLTQGGKELRIVQPYISRRNAAGEAYDFRVHVQKNGMGKWAVTSLFPRIAPLGIVPTNFGYTSYNYGFMRVHFGDECWNAIHRMEQFGLQLAAHLDRIYGVSFDELGIDLVLDEEGRIWLLEANWRPGPPPTFDLEMDAPRRTVQYAMYLHRQANRGSGYS